MQKMVNSKAVGSSLKKTKKIVNGGWLGVISVLSAMGISGLPTSSVFLPAAGNRNGTSVNNVGSNGNYWSSTANDSDNAWNLNFNGSDANMNNNNRYNGQSVRLVRVVQNLHFYA